MPTDTDRRVLATFDAFLEYVRGGSAPRPLAAAGFSDERTDPSLSAERLGLDPPAPRKGGSRAGRGDFDDDEATVVGNIPQPKAPPSTSSEAARRAAAPKPEPEQSIIVDDQALEPEQPVAQDGSRGEGFVREMATLMKYGHAAQVPQEINRFARAHGDDLDGLFRVAEFEYARVDAEQGLERLFQCASRALDAGDLQLARRVLERAGRAAPSDLRVLALTDRVRGR